MRSGAQSASEAVRFPQQGDLGEAEAVGLVQEVEELLGAAEDFRQRVGPAGGEEFGPVVEPWERRRHAFRHLERPHLLAQHLRMEQRLGFDGHELPAGYGSRRKCQARQQAERDGFSSTGR